METLFRLSRLIERSVIERFIIQSLFMDIYVTYLLSGLLILYLGFWQFGNPNLNQKAYFWRVSLLQILYFCILLCDSFNVVWYYVMNYLKDIFVVTRDGSCLYLSVNIMLLSLMADQVEMHLKKAFLKCTKKKYP